MITGTGFEALTLEECRSLLRTTGVGRLALSAGALPVIVPVAYELEDSHVTVHMPSDDDLEGRRIDGQVVAFEVDQLAEDGTGWCVSVTGHAHAHPSVPAASGSRWFGDGVTLLVDTDIVTGRRLRP